MTAPTQPLKPRYLPHYINSKYLDKELKAAEKFFKKLPPVCPFCGWIGGPPEHHGYTEDWMCPILWLAINIRELRGGRYISEEEIKKREDNIIPYKLKPKSRLR